MTISALQSPEPTASLLFEEFFDLGKVETMSPFLSPRSRRWGVNLSLKISILSAFLLLLSFIFSFYYPPVSNILLMGVYFFVGMPALIESLEALGSFEVNIDILMTIAAFSSVIIGSGMEGGLLLVLFALSGSMEDFVTTKARNDISNLHKLAPTKACIIRPDGTIFERSVKEIEVGTHILIRAGQLAPLDGIVIDGISSVNLVHITGESIPITKKVGDTVPAGARNTEGTLTLRVTHTSADSTLARIIQLVTQAQEERPILQRWFDKLSRGYAITLMSLAALFALTMPYFLSIPYLGVEGSIYRALAFLIAASPCALIIAIPIAYLSAIGVCARQGILLKGGLSLDALARCKTIIFDKTGTLTTGELSLIDIEAISGTVHSSEIDEAVAVAYALERNAIHPIAKAIVAYAQKRNLTNITIEEFKAIPGHGLKAIAQLNHGPQEVYIGHADYILSKVDEELGNAIVSHAGKAKSSGELVAILLIGQKAYLLRFRDTLRKGIEHTIEELKDRNLRLIMLTGDNEESAYRIARDLNLDEYYANLRPEDKLHYVSQLAGKEDLAMIGDGVNDAPALARATVGICMGKVGSTAAIDAADVILLQDNIELLGWLFKKAHQTQRVVVQNLILATLAILIASFPALAGVVPLWLAVIMHEGGTVLVGLNGLRLLKR